MSREELQLFCVGKVSKVAKRLMWEGEREGEKTPRNEIDPLEGSHTERLRLTVHSVRENHSEWRMMMTIMMMLTNMLDMLVVNTVRLLIALPKALPRRPVHDLSFLSFSLTFSDIHILPECACEYFSSNMSSFRRKRARAQTIVINSKHSFALSAQFIIE